MTTTSVNAVLQAAAKVLAWELYAAAGYGRTRAYVNVEKFDCAMRTAARQWREAQSNLKPQKEGVWKHRKVTPDSGGRGTSTS